MQHKCFHSFLSVHIYVAEASAVLSSYSHATCVLLFVTEVKLSAYACYYLPLKTTFVCYYAYFYMLIISAMNIKMFRNSQRINTFKHIVLVLADVEV